MSTRFSRLVVAAIVWLLTLPCAGGCQKILEQAFPTQHPQQTILTGKPQPQAPPGAANHREAVLN